MRPDTRAGRYLEARGGETGYTVIVQTDDLERRRARAVELAIRELCAAVSTGSEPATFTHGTQVARSCPSTSQSSPPSGHGFGAEWRRAVRTDVTIDLRAATVEVADPPAVAQRWAALPERDVAFTDDTPVVCWIGVVSGSSTPCPRRVKA